MAATSVGASVEASDGEGNVDDGEPRLAAPSESYASSTTSGGSSSSSGSGSEDGGTTDNKTSWLPDDNKLRNVYFEKIS